MHCWKKIELNSQWLKIRIDQDDKKNSKKSCSEHTHAFNSLRPWVTRTPYKLMRNGLGCEKVVLKMSISFMAYQITIRTI